MNQALPMPPQPWVERIKSRRDFHIVDVISFATSGFGSAHMREAPGTLEALLYLRTISEERVVLDDPPGIAALVERDLVPLLAGRNGSRLGGSTRMNVRPFLQTPGGDVLAGEFVRRGQQAVWWFLPQGADLTAWIRLALAAWHERDPERFPLRTPWVESPEWATPEETGIRGEIDQLDSAFAKSQRDYVDSRQELDARLERAVSSADDHERRLVTSQGADLSQAVKQCLEAFGYEVVDVDSQRADGAARTRGSKGHGRRSNVYR